MWAPFCLEAAAGVKSPSRRTGVSPARSGRGGYRGGRGRTGGYREGGAGFFAPLEGL